MSSGDDLSGAAIAAARPATLEMPAPTHWPMALALGLMLMCASLLIGVVGTLLAIVAAVGWFRDVLPGEARETVPVLDRPPVITTRRREVARVALAGNLPRAWLPLESYPISSGIKGGLAGGVAMALLAMAYGVVNQTSIWYAVNLLAAGVFPEAAAATTADLAAFSPTAFLVALAIHVLMSLLVGLLYGAMLPMLPRRPILLGGIVAPIVWSGLIVGVLGVVNPVLDRRVDWPWFVLSQIGFGLVAGSIVSRSGSTPTPQPLPMLLRAGIEMTGIRRGRRVEDRER